MTVQLTANFHRDEFRCRCRDRGVDTDDNWCHGASWPHRELVVRLQALREHYDRPITVTSGCRCPSYNSHIGGAPRSQHIRGAAADIKLFGVFPAAVALVARGMGFYVIEYPTFTHVDVRAEI